MKFCYEAMSISGRQVLSGMAVLIVEDESLLRRRLTRHLEQLGAEVTAVEDLARARDSAADVDFDFVLLDVNLPDGSGMDLLRERVFGDATGVVIMTAEGGVSGAVEAMKLGAVDYLAKPFDPGVLPLVMGRARKERQSARAAEYGRASREDDSFFFGEGLQSVRQQLTKIVEADRRMLTQLPPVLITGETGTGKSTLARWIHEQGPRAQGPFIAVNCPALPDTLAESELFGHERGAFTDARNARQGLFEAAHGGTLFLDELPSLSSSLQAKILTVLEDRKIRRLGGNRMIEVDVRVIAATNIDLRAAVAAREFREDLLHRLDLYRIDLPPLRQRGDDLLRLADHLLQDLCRKHRLPLREITHRGRTRLLAYRWPGNVRELAHALERALVFEETATLEFAHLAEGHADGQSSAEGSADWLNPSFQLVEGEFSLEDATNRLIQLALRQSNHNVSAAARLLGVTRDFIRYRLEGNRKDDDPAPHGSSSGSPQH
jgi:DNA-binding NtrC family response regulator